MISYFHDDVLTSADLVRMTPEVIFCNTSVIRNNRRVAFRTKLQFFYKCILTRCHQFWDAWDIYFVHFIILDIGVNLTDTMYQGEYHGKTKHQPDLESVLERSWQNGLEKMIITGGSLEDAKKALEVAKTSGE